MSFNNRIKQKLNENLLYEDGVSERIHPELEEQLRNNKHSLAECGIFPEGDLISSEMKLIRERFSEVVYRCREAFNVDAIDNRQIMMEMYPLVEESMKLERPHIKELEKLAVEIVMEEFDIPEDSVILEAKLVTEIDLSKTKKNPSPEMVDEVFNNHEEIKEANSQVKKRRALNAMIQGAAKKVNHMFHMVNNDLVKLNPKLPNNYKKMMSAADYLYYIVPDLNNSSPGGVCECEFSKDEDDLRPIIKAEAKNFPVLVHELVKGLMEVLASHGLPTEKNIAEFVINKADYLEAEPWDMRLGPAIWGKFCEAIPDNDFELKHHVFTEVAKLPSNEFNITMKEVLANTKRGKEIMSEIVENIKSEIKDDEFNEAMGDNFFDIDELF